MESLRRLIENYTPCGDQEQADRALMLYSLQLPDILTRQNPLAHFTASAWIVNPSRTQVLMVYHNIYNSWSWTGGHADGDADLFSVALREAVEETGDPDIRPVSRNVYSLEALCVPQHYKNGLFVSAHTHLNATFLLEAGDHDSLAAKPDENSGVRWFPLQRSVDVSSETFMKGVYAKLNDRLRAFPAGCDDR